MNLGGVGRVCNPFPKPRGMDISGTSLRTLSPPSFTALSRTLTFEPGVNSLAQTPARAAGGPPPRFIIPVVYSSGFAREFCEHCPTASRFV